MDLSAWKSKIREVWKQEVWKEEAEWKNGIRWMRKKSWKCWMPTRKVRWECLRSSLQIFWLLFLLLPPLFLWFQAMWKARLLYSRLLPWMRFLVRCSMKKRRNPLQVWKLYRHQQPRCSEEESKVKSLLLRLLKVIFCFLRRGIWWQRTAESLKAILFRWMRVRWPGNLPMLRRKQLFLRENRHWEIASTWFIQEVL